MGFTDAISALNQLKKRHVIRDYVIIGAVAAAAYLEARSTADLDVIILADTDEEYIRTFGLIAQQSEGQEGMHLILEGVPVQVFPTANMPLYQDTLDWGRVIRSGSMRTKVATPEHLILLGLLANREDDHGRIRHLLRISDFERLTGLLERFDDEQETLAARLQNLRGTSIPREGDMASPPGPD